MIEFVERVHDLMLLVILSAPVLNIVLWFFLGRDPSFGKCLEFYPPEDIDPAEVGYIIDGIVDSKDMVALLIHFADQGYLRIEEEHEDKFILEKCRELPATASSYEVRMFDGLFFGRDRVSSDELKGTFYSKLRNAQRSLKEYFTKEKSRRMFTQNSIYARSISFLLMAIPLLAFVFLEIVYETDTLKAALVAAPFVIAALVVEMVLIWMYDRMFSISTETRMMGGIAGGVILLGSLVGLVLVGYWYTGGVLYGITASVASLLTFFLAARMKTRTKQSAALLKKILGFKEFIRSAKPNEIQELAQKDPHYFYRVLPYAYVFGLTERWAEKFEGLVIPRPSWYHSDYYNDRFNTILFLNTFKHFTRTMQASVAVPPSAQNKTNK